MNASNDRVYAISVGRTLFGEHELAIAWGRLRGRTKKRFEYFADEGALARRLRELAARRRRHDYVQTSEGSGVITRNQTSRPAESSEEPGSYCYSATSHT